MMIHLSLFASFLYNVIRDNNNEEKLERAPVIDIPILRKANKLLKHLTN